MLQLTSKHGLSQKTFNNVGLPYRNHDFYKTWQNIEKQSDLTLNISFCPTDCRKLQNNEFQSVVNWLNLILIDEFDTETSNYSNYCWFKAQIDQF